MLAYILAVIAIYCVWLLVCGGADLLIELVLFPGKTKLAHAANMDEPDVKTSTVLIVAQKGPKWKSFSS